MYQDANSSPTGHDSRSNRRNDETRHDRETKDLERQLAQEHQPDKACQGSQCFSTTGELLDEEQHPAR